MATTRAEHIATTPPLQSVVAGMPFCNRTVDEERRRLAYMVLVDGESVSAAARHFGVSRTTAHLWVARAREQGLSELSSLSSRPHEYRAHVSDEVVELILAKKKERPYWGGRKLHAVLWPEGNAPVCARTVDRVLRRNAQCSVGAKKPVEVGRFERAEPNELWQIDFKGLGENPPPGYRILSVLDDCSRFAVALRTVERASKSMVFDALWGIFEQYGLPDAVLTDNERCFHTHLSLGPSYMEARLWRLGVRAYHGRPAHPQTQGKVERFHRTMELEMGTKLRLQDRQQAQQELDLFRNDYNWERPHDSLHLKIPGACYKPSQKPRPPQLPELIHPQGVEIRSVDPNGRFTRKGIRYCVGMGLAGETVGLLEDENGIQVSYAGVNFALLSELQV